VQPPVAALAVDIAHEVLGARAGVLGRLSEPVHQLATAASIPMSPPANAPASRSATPFAARAACDKRKPEFKGR
jgi:hypothetical protein